MAGAIFKVSYLCFEKYLWATYIQHGPHLKKIQWALGPYCSKAGQNDANPCLVK